MPVPGRVSAIELMYVYLARYGSLIIYVYLARYGSLIMTVFHALFSSVFVCFTQSSCCVGCSAFKINVLVVLGAAHLK